MPLSYPLALPVALLALAPIVVLLQLSDAPEQLFEARNLGLISNTLLLTFFTALGSVLIGVPLALLTAYVRLPWTKLWLVLLAAPLALPSYIGAFAFYAAFGPGGEIEQLLGLPTPRLNGLLGAALVMSLYTYPFVLMTTRAALLNQPVNQIHAARTLGLSLPASLWRVVLPRALNGVAAGALLAALYALSDFGTPAIMGLDTFTRVIYVEYNAFGLGQAALLSLQLLLIVALVLFVESRVSKTSERPGRSLLVQAQPWHILLSAVAVAPFLLLALVLPLALFTVWLWRDGSGDFDFTIAWNSLLASVLAALGAVLVALPVAYAALAGRFGRILERISFLGFGIPGIVMGTALVYVGLQLPSLYQTLGLLVVAYIMRFLPLAVGAIRATAESQDESLSKAARVLGARPPEVFTRVTVPLTRRGIVAGAAL
ncbi:MAG: ABC transporter permease subunit, partial [Cellvibrionaceae bacterium]|nr:ABC transporter permease subunit [Cellvibrionaceae bacterium]